MATKLPPHPPYESDIDPRFPLHFEHPDTSYWIPPDNHPLTTLVDTFDKRSTSLFKSLNIAAMACVAYSIRPYDRITNPDNPESSPLFFRITITEEQVHRWPKLHEPLLKLIGGMFPLEYYPRFGPEYIVRYDLNMPTTSELWDD